MIFQVGDKAKFRKRDSNDFPRPGTVKEVDDKKRAVKVPALLENNDLSSMVTKKSYHHLMGLSGGQIVFEKSTGTHTISGYGSRKYQPNTIIVFLPGDNTLTSLGFVL